jgi:hypothetical protein
MPSRIVIDGAWIIFFRFPSIRLWCAQVMDTPDVRRTDVLRRGTSKGFSGSMLVGGQQPPSSGVGARLEW